MVAVVPLSVLTTTRSNGVKAGAADVTLKVLEALPSTELREATSILGPPAALGRVDVTGVTVAPVTLTSVITVVIEHACRAVRSSVRAPHAAPPFCGGVTMVRVRRSVRVCSPFTHMPKGPVGCHAENSDSTQSIGVGLPPPPGGLPPPPGGGGVGGGGSGGGGGSCGAGGWG